MPSKTVVGLDIGSTRIRGVEATSSSNHPHVTGVASVALPVGAVEGGEIKNIPEFTTALKELWKHGKFTAKDVRVVINSEDNIARISTLNDEIDFGKVLPIRIKSVESFKFDDYYLSYHTIRKYEVEVADSSRLEGFKIVPKRDILLAGSKKTTIDTLVDAFNQADLRPLSVDIAPLSILRAEGEPLGDEAPEDTIDIHVNVGGDMTTLVFSHDIQPVYIRIIDIGGNTINDAIAEHLDIDYEYAERLKLDTLTMNPRLLSKSAAAARSIFDDDEENKDEEADEELYTADQLDAYSIVNEELSIIISKINRTINFFIENNKQGLGQHIRNIYISGATAAFDQIKTRLVHEVGAEQTLLSNPLSRLAQRGMISKGLPEQFAQNEHEYTLAVGAILGDGGKNNG